MKRQLLAAAAVVVLLAGCSNTSGRPSSSDNLSGSLSGGLSGTSSQASGAPRSATSPLSGPGSVIADDPSHYRLARDAPSSSLYLLASGATFQTPSHNIRCDVIADDDAVCVIAQETFPLPVRPSSCGHNWESSTVTLDARGVQLGLCSGGEVVHYSGTVLPYGHSLTAGRITCVSAESGLTCRLAGTTHGFTLSRAALHRV